MGNKASVTAHSRSHSDPINLLQFVPKSSGRPAATSRVKLAAAQQNSEVTRINVRKRMHTSRVQTTLMSSPPEATAKSGFFLNTSPEVVRSGSNYMTRDTEKCGKTYRLLRQGSRAMTSPIKGRRSLPEDLKDRVIRPLPELQAYSREPLRRQSTLFADVPVNAHERPLESQHSLQLHAIAAPTKSNVPLLAKLHLTKEL